MHTDDTIVAISSPPGSGWRGIVRITGPEAWRLAADMLESPPDLVTWRASAPRCFTGKMTDPPLPTLALLFAGPKSFTGQDVAELHVPGSVALLQHIVGKLIHAGARQAQPGEFSARAFFSGKMDLTQAEGIAATINATNERQLQAATALRQGELYKWTNQLADSLGNLLALVEAAIDFTDEPGVSFISTDTLGTTLDQLHRSIAELQRTAIRIERLDTLPTVVLLGKPNVGKSSLINALAGQDRAIVSSVAGTTRDTLAAVMTTDRGNFRLVDVAGEEPPVDELRQKMATAREAALMDADLILQVIDQHDNPQSYLRENPRKFPAPILVVQNKADLLAPPTTHEEFITPHADALWISVSAKTGMHLDRLRHTIAQLAVQREPEAWHQMSLNQRHRIVLHEVEKILIRAMHLACDGYTVERNPEFIACELRLALNHLGEISGTISPDEVLGRIFSTFCVGK